MSTEDDLLVTTASVDEVLQAIEAVDLNASWEDVAPKLRLALPRRRAMPPSSDDLPTREFPPGVQVGLGLDIGPAMLFVGTDQIAGWGVSADEAFDQALENVRARVASRRQFALMHEHIGGVPTIAFQSREGWASSLLLLPDQLKRVLGDDDGLILAPMRDLILQLPIDTEPGFALFLLEEFAEADMNALDLPIFVRLEGELHRTLAVPAPAPREATMH
jgi:hypothetical protein